MHVRPVSSRARHLAAILVLVMVAGLLLSAQPLRSPWWTGHDFDTVYAASAVSLFRGERSRFFDHPGLPLQEMLAAALTLDWAVAGAGESRSERADRYLADLDLLRPHLRVLGALLFLGSALIAYAAIAWLTGSAAAGLFAGLVLLAAPDVTVWAAVVKPDPLLGALSVASVALLVAAARRRSAGHYLAAAAAVGFAVTVKVHALGLLAPLAVALVLWPPGALDLRGLRSRGRWLAAVAGVWLFAAVALNALAAPPRARDVLLVGAAALAAAAVAGAAWLVTRRTRACAWVELAAGVGAAGLAGFVVPNLLYASVPAPALKWLGVTLTGRGVEASVGSAVPPWDVLRPWAVLVALAAVGAVLALQSDRTASLWLVAAAAMGGLALLRYGSVHYYTAAIALLAPLALPALAVLSRWPPVLAFAVAAALYPPLSAQVHEARGRGEIAASTERVNAWVEPRLADGEVALTFLEHDDARTFALVRHYARVPDRRYRFLPATSDGAAFAETEGLVVRYVVAASEADPATLAATLGLESRPAREAAPGFVYSLER